MRRIIVLLIKPIGLSILFSVVFGILHSIEKYVDLGWLVEFINEKSKPSLEKAPYLIFTAFILLALVIAKGKQRKTKDHRVIKLLRDFGRWTGKSGAYILCAVSGLLIGVGLSDKIYAGTINLPYISTGVFGLASGIFVYLFAYKISEDLRHLVGRLEGQDRKFAAILGVGFSVATASVLLYDIWSKTKI